MYQLCAVNPQPLDPAEALAIFTTNVFAALREIGAPTRTLEFIKRDPDHPLFLTLEYNSLMQAHLAFTRIRSFRVAQGGFVFKARSYKHNRVLLEVMGSRVLADLEHPDGAGRPTESELDDAPTEPAAPVVTYAHRPVNKYAGPATRPALVTSGPIPSRFRQPQEARTS
jgi:hypothetical protein